MIKMIPNSVYSISDTGVVRNEKTGKEVISKYGPDGYPCVGLCIDGKSVRRYVHRLVAEAFVDKPDDPRMNCVTHVDGNNYNNTPSNLRWDSFKNIMQGKHKEGAFEYAHEKRERRIQVFDMVNISEIEFNSITEFAIYLQSIDEELSTNTVSGIASNIVICAKNNGRLYNRYKVKYID